MVPRVQRVAEPRGVLDRGPMMSEWP